MTEVRPSAQTKDIVVDAVVLAFANSGLKKVVGTDAFRSLLNLQYHELFREDVLDLGQIWELISDQPGFTEAAAKPPFCRIKGWERELGMRMDLPPPLSDISPEDQLALARDCPVGFDELERVLRRIDRKTARFAELARQEATVVVPDAQVAGPRSFLHRPGVLPAALVIGLGALAFTAVFVYREFGGSVSVQSAAVDFGEIPATEAGKRGNEVGGTLTDLSWMQLPEETRKKQMEKVLRSLEAEHVQMFFLIDQKGTLRATARWADQHDIAFAFYAK